MLNQDKKTSLWAQLLLLAFFSYSLFFLGSFIELEVRLQKELNNLQTFLNSPGDLVVLNSFNQQGSFIKPGVKPYDVTRILNLNTNKVIKLYGLGQFVYTSFNDYCIDEYIFTTRPLIINARQQTVGIEVLSSIANSLPFLSETTNYLSRLLLASAQKKEFARTRFIWLNRKQRQAKFVYPDSELVGYMTNIPIFVQIDSKRHLYYLNGYWGAVGKTEKDLLVILERNQLKLFRDLQPVITSRNPYVLIGHSNQNLLFFNVVTRKEFKMHNIDSGINTLYTLSHLPDFKSVQQFSMSLDELDKKWVWSGVDINGQLLTVILDFDKQQTSLLKKDWNLVSGNPPQHSFVLMHSVKQDNLPAGIEYAQFIHLKSQLIEVQTVFHQLEPSTIFTRNHIDTISIDIKTQKQPQFYIKDIFDSNFKPIKLTIPEKKPFMIAPIIIQDSMHKSSSLDNSPNSLRALNVSTRNRYQSQISDPREN